MGKAAGVMLIESVDMLEDEGEWEVAGGSYQVKNMKEGGLKVMCAEGFVDWGEK